MLVSHGLRGSWRSMRLVVLQSISFFCSIMTRAQEVPLALDYARSEILNPGEEPPFDPLDFQSDIRGLELSDEVAHSLRSAPRRGLIMAAVSEEPSTPECLTG